MMQKTAAGSVELLTQVRAIPRARIVASGVRKAKQRIPRKELQKRAKQEYLRRIYETADRVEEDHLVFELQPSSPRVRAELQESDQHAALNQQLSQQIPQLATWEQLQQFLQQYADSLNFLNAVAAVSKAAALSQVAWEQQPAGMTASAATAAAAPPAAAAATDAATVSLLARLVLQHSSWFQPPHFATSAVALSALGVADEAVWSQLTGAAQPKVVAFTFAQLSDMMEAMAAAGYTPGLSWIERTYRQAAKHLHAADPADMAVLMGAWGEMGYTPRDRLFMNQVKILTRRAFDQRQLSGVQLVMLLHGLARMPRYVPNHGWLSALARATRRQLEGLSPGAVVDLLLSYAALGFSPEQRWMDAALGRLQAAMDDLLQDYSSSAAPEVAAAPGGAVQQQQEERWLLLPPLDLQQLTREVQLQEPGVLLAQRGVSVDEEQPQLPFSDLDELQRDMEEVQLLFDEAEAEQYESADEEGAANGYDDGSGRALVVVGMRHQQQQQETQQDSSQGQVAQPDSAGQQLQQAAPSPRLRFEATGDTSKASQLSLRHQLLQQQLTPEQVGVLCWCLARLQYQPTRPWMQQLGRVLLLVLPDTSPEVLVDVLSGCVSGGYLPVSLLQQQLLSCTLQQVPHMVPEGLRRTCQALAAWEAGLKQYQQQPTALKLLQQQGLPAGEPEDLLQPLLHLKQQLAAAITHRLGIVLTGSNTVQIADVLAYVAAAEQTPPLDFMAAAVTRAVSKLPDGAPKPAVVTLLWALARCGFKPHPQLLHHLLAALQQSLHLLSSTDLADVGWALCTLRHRPSATWLSMYLKEAAAKAGFMQAQQLTDTLWALACFAAQPDREWLKLVLQAVSRQAAMGSLSRENAAVVVWALQQLGLRPAEVAPAAAAPGSRGGVQADGSRAGGMEGAAVVQQGLGGAQSAVWSLLQLVQPA